jgi:hypothetical protein
MSGGNTGVAWAGAAATSDATSVLVGNNRAFAACCAINGLHLADIERENGATVVMVAMMTTCSGGRLGNAPAVLRRS